MNLDELRTFQAIVQYGSFTKAADKLCCTQSTVSLRIKRLEQQLGAPLLKRSRNTKQDVTLTPAGRDVLPFIEEALTKIDQARALLARQDGALPTEISVIASHTPGLFLIPEALTAFHEHHPDVNVTTHVSYTREVLDALSNNLSIYDFGLVSQPDGFRHDRLEVVPILDDRLAVIVSDALYAKCGGRVRIKDLARFTLLVTNKASSITEYLKRETGVVPERVLVLGSIESVKAAVLKGMGFAMLSQHAVREELSQGRLREVARPSFRRVATSISSTPGIASLRPRCVNSSPKSCAPLPPTPPSPTVSIPLPPSTS